MLLLLSVYIWLYISHTKKNVRDNLGFLGQKTMGQIYFLRIIYKMFRSFCITIRPRDGIKDNLVAKIIDWLHKQPYAVAVLEMEGEARHLHAQIWTSTPKHKNDIGKQIKRFCEALIPEWDNAQSKVLRGGIKIAYSDWYLEYLTNNDDKNFEPNIIYHKPPDKTEFYYPTEEEQNRVKNVANSIDPRFTKLEQDYWQWLTKGEDIICDDDTLTLESVGKFLSWSMFKVRTIKVIIQQKDRIALAQALHLYVTKSESSKNFMVKDPNEKKYKKGLDYVMNSLKLDNIIDI